MKLLVKSNHFRLAITLFVTFWVTASFIPNDIILLITNSLVLAISAAVFIAYLPQVWRALRDDSLDRIRHIVLGICYAWGFSWLWRLWSLIWLTGGKPDWAIQNDLIAFFQAGVFLGGVYHLTSPNALYESVPSLRWIITGLVIGGGVLLACGLTFLHPDTAGFLEWIKPYVPR